MGSFILNVSVAVADNGCGVPAGYKLKMFEPYFSTKKSGTGLGLAIVSSIISDHHGHISVKDNPAGGTIVAFELPTPEHREGDGEVAVAAGWPEGKPSTKNARGILGKLGMGASATVVTTAVDRNLCLSLRNVPLVDVRTVDDLNARQVLLRRYLVLTPAALEAIQQRFGKKEA